MTNRYQYQEDEDGRIQRKSRMTPDAWVGLAAIFVTVLTTFGINLYNNGRLAQTVEQHGQVISEIKGDVKDTNLKVDKLTRGFDRFEGYVENGGFVRTKKPDGDSRGAEQLEGNK